MNLRYHRQELPAARPHRVPAPSAAPPEALASQDVRERMAAIGAWLPRPLRLALQAFLTWVTGRPHRGQTPLLRWTPAYHLVVTLLCLAGSVAVSLWALAASGPALLVLPVSLLLTVSSQRKIFLSLVHATLHQTFCRSRRGSRAAAEALTMLIFTQPPRRLRIEHVRKHHGRTFCTLADPDVQTLYVFGMQPGLPRHRLWLRFFRTMLSPRFHLLFAWARIKSNAVDSTPLRRVFLPLAIAATGVAVHLLEAWPELVVCWLLPLFPGFHVAALLTFTGEHKWFRMPDGDRRSWLVEQTQGRFVGSPPPDASRGRWARALWWPLWWVQLVGWHLPLRLLAVPADMPAHDHHHLNVKGDWANALYHRQRQVERGAPYTETWGVFAAIDSVFRELAHLPPVADPGPAKISSALLDM